MSKVKKKREWKVNSEEQYRKKEGREGVAEEEEEKTKRWCQQAGQKIEEKELGK